MSYNSNRSLNGNANLEIDTLTLTEWIGALSIEGDIGSAGQVLKKNANSNNIEWGVDTPGSLSAVTPIVLNGTQLSFNPNLSSLNLITAGSITGALITSTGNIVAYGDIIGDDATNIEGINNIECVKLTTSGDIVANGNIVGDNGTNLTSIKDIGCVKLTASGNIEANGNIVGDNGTNITGIGQLQCVSVTAGGNINANGNIVGSVQDLSSMTGMDLLSDTNKMTSIQKRKIYKGSSFSKDITTSFTIIKSGFQLDFTARATQYIFRFGFYNNSQGGDNKVLFQLNGYEGDGPPNPQLIGTATEFIQPDTNDKNYINGILILENLDIGDVWHINIFVKESSSSSKNKLLMGGGNPIGYLECEPVYSTTSLFT